MDKTCKSDHYVVYNRIKKILTYHTDIKDFKTTAKEAELGEFKYDENDMDIYIIKNGLLDETDKYVCKIDSPDNKVIYLHSITQKKGGTKCTIYDLHSGTSLYGEYDIDEDIPSEFICNCGNSWTTYINGKFHLTRMEDDMFDGLKYTCKRCVRYGEDRMGFGFE